MKKTVSKGANTMKVAKRRSKEDILTGILISALKGTNKTKLMYDNIISFNQLKKYLDYALSNGLIKEIESNNEGSRTRRIYITTDSGRRYLSIYNKLNESEGDGDD
jgi:predicted transcriptional regulator